MIITDITKQKKGERVNLFIDGKFFCGLSAECVFKYRLKIGQEIQQSQIEQMAFDTDKESAFNKVANYISKRLKTEREIRNYLIDKGYLETIADYVIAKLKEYKYVDDKTYIDAFIRSNPNKGKKLIKQKLMEKGISKVWAEEAVSKIDDQSPSIEMLCEKYLKNKERNLDNKTKTYRYLLSKGFDYNQIDSVIRKVFTNVEED